MRTVAETTTLDAQLAGQMEAANTALLACTAMGAGDVTAWNGLYSGWQATHTYWQQLTADGWDPIAKIDRLAAAGLASDTTYDQLTAIATQLPAYQVKIHAACPSYTPPPGIATPAHDAATDLIPKLEHAAEVIGGVMATIAVSLLVIKVVEVIGDFRSIAKA